MEDVTREDDVAGNGSDEDENDDESDKGGNPDGRLAITRGDSDMTRPAPMIGDDGVVILVLDVGK